MPVTVVCPECGAKQAIDEDSELAARCGMCRATLTAAAGSRVFVASAPTKKKKRKKRSPPSPQQVADGEFRQRARRGLNWLLLALFASMLAAVAGKAAAPMQDIAGNDLPPWAVAWWTAQLAGVAAAGCAYAATQAFRPLGKPLDHALPTEWAWRLGAGLLPVAVLTSLIPALGFLAELAWLANWVLYLLLVTVVERICVRTDRGDLRDSAEFVLRMGIGVVVFAAAAWLFGLVGMMGLVGLRALAMMFALFAVCCLALWTLSYAVLIFRVRMALRGGGAATIL